MRTSTILSPFLVAILCLGCASGKLPQEDKGFIVGDQGHRIFFEKFGDGPQKILIPGGMYLSPTFRSLANDDRTIVLYDQRGRGKSSAIHDTSMIGWQGELDDIEAIRRHFRFDRLSYVGWSYSGAIAALYAEAYPDRVDRIVLVGPLPPRKDPHYYSYQKTWNSRRDSSHARQMAAVATAFKESGDLVSYIRDSYKLLHGPMLYRKDAVETFREDFFTCENERPDLMWGRHFPTLIASFGDWNFGNLREGINCPALIIHGDYDEIPLAASREWHEIIPDSRLFVLEEAGHLPFFDRPSILFSTIDKFLAGAWPSESSE